jgi:hypothetical protein
MRKNYSLTGPSQKRSKILRSAIEQLESRTLLSSVFLTATDDTYVRPGANTADSNFDELAGSCALPLSGSSCLVVRNDNGTNSGALSRITYLKFNTSGLVGTINSATLRLFGLVANPGEAAHTDELRGVANIAWTEDTLTYNNRPLPDAGVLDTQSVSGTTLKAYNWNVASWATSHPGSALSFALQEATQGGVSHLYRTHEWTTDDQRPKLIMSVGAPDAPRALTATPGNAQITLNWANTEADGEPVDATSWSVYRGTTSGGESLIAGNITTNSFVDTTVSNGVDYFYFVIASNVAGNSAQSTQVGPVRPVISPAPAPSPITVTEGIGTIGLSWDPVPFADSYNVYRSDSAAGPFLPQPAPTGTSFSDTVAPGSKWFYKVSSVNVAGEGPLSPVITATAGIVGNGIGITANYYDNVDFTGPLITRIDPTINFPWDTCCNPNGDPAGGSPDPSMNGDLFSSRYIGDVQAQFTQPYTFYTASDDGVRLWLEDPTTHQFNLIVDKWILQGTTEWASAPVNLVAGQKYHIRLDFFENFGGASTFLSWSSPSTPKDIIPSTQLYPDDGVPRLPVAPVNLRADALDSSQVCVRWTDVAYDETSFLVQRSPKSDFSAGVVNVSLPAAPNLSACVDQVGETISGLTRGTNTTTATTPAPHGLSVGSTVIISGATPASFNGTFTVNAVPTPTTFTFANAGPNESASAAGKYVTSYFYRIATVNAVGTSNFTATTSPVLPTGAAVANYPSFPDATGWSLVSLPAPNPPGASVGSGRLHVVSAVDGADGAAWLNNVKIIDSFTASFDMQITGSNGADGMTFTIQGNGPTALGGAGGGLGFAGMPNSVGIKFDFYPQINHSGVYINGDMNDNLGTTLGSATNVGNFGIDFDGPAGAGVVYHVDVAYDGAVLLYTITDTTNHGKTVSIQVPVDIAGIIGTHCAWVGFTAGNGGLHAQQDVLNFNFNSGVPVVNGTTAPDTFYVRLDTPGGNKVRVWKNHNPDVDPADVEMPKASINNLALSGGASTDTFTIDFSNGNPLPAGGLLVDGGMNDDTLIVTGTSAAESFSVNGTTVTVPGGGTFRHTGLNFANFNLGANGATDADDSLSVSGNPDFSPVLNGGGGNNTITIDSSTYASTADNLAGNNDGAGHATLNVIATGTTTIASSSNQHLKSLALNNTAKLTLPPAAGKLLRTNGLTIAAGAALDVGDGDVILQSSAATKQADWNTLMSLLRSGRAGGLWTGNGVRSAAAAANALHTTGIGIVLNDNGSGATILGTFNGEAVDANTILLKYTYNGDSNLDGDVDADDYAGIDDGFANRANANNLTFPRQPWLVGDFNLSNSINSDDYFLIDNAFSNQTTVLAAPSAPMPAASITIAKTATKARHKHHRNATPPQRSFLFRVRD